VGILKSKQTEKITEQSPKKVFSKHATRFKQTQYGFMAGRGSKHYSRICNQQFKMVFDCQTVGKVFTKVIFGCYTLVYQKGCRSIARCSRTQTRELVWANRNFKKVL